MQAVSDIRRLFCQYVSDPSGRLWVFLLLRVDGRPGREKDCRDAAELCANICPGGRIPDTNEEMGRTEEIY